MRTYIVYYTKTTQGDIDVEASSPTEAQKMVEDGDVDFGNAREYDDAIDCYEVESNEGNTKENGLDDHEDN